MPWKECAHMDEKLLFIADHLRGGAPLSELCRRYGISRKTAYKWVERYRQLGMDGLQERSRRPHGNNQAISYAQRRAIIERSEEHTSELQSPCNLVCRLLLEKKKKHRSGCKKIRST